MRLYTVHLKDEPPAGGDPPAFELVKDGFCWPALFVPLLWGIWRGQWTGLLAYLLVVLATSTLTVMAGPGEAAEVALGIGLALLTGFSANDWRRWRLRRMGYRDLGAVAAADAEQAALRVLQHLQRPGALPERLPDWKTGSGLPNKQADTRKPAGAGPWERPDPAAGSPA